MIPGPFVSPDAVGVTVVVCDAHRCRALRGRTATGADGGHRPLLDILRDAVRRSRGGVLVRSQCLGACHRAPAVLLLARHEPPRSPAEPGVLLGPVETPEQVRMVLEVVQRAGGPKE
ncbi:(2Fe-2S) ferredoxin domain-containing protein [Micromonospora sp. AMSO31t]|uniref:(2Fe-2S) ferredoxin domain-containing protein n=1 Tax=Micromonospora sp. AMSO31t TaxID=2650566 RepID=UPI00124B789E|nr:(2Fe-2S) ferredoxin domain-containing protein [Micromonospora sp. AMSO31t]KAB1915639.1 (2Fe-2S) ferredoxin domain-containing protein [Micromonospora sp. AMSO31t]